MSHAWLDSTFLKILFLWLQWISCHGYSSGAPDTACHTMAPHHGLAKSSTDTSPFVVLVDKNTYQPNDVIKVMLRGLCSNKFNGFLVEARRADLRMNTTERIGTFTEVNQSRYACGHETALTHLNHESKNVMLLTWTAPHIPSGHVIIKATFVKRFSTFWVGINSVVIADPRAVPLNAQASESMSSYITPCPEDLATTTTSPPPTTSPMSTATTSTIASTIASTKPPIGPSPTITIKSATTSSPIKPVQPPYNTLHPTTTTSTTDIHRTPHCGITHGCFVDCLKGACKFQIAWRDMGNIVWFQLRAVALPNAREQWIAIGFSKDTRMTPLPGPVNVTGQNKLFYVYAQSQAVIADASRRLWFKPSTASGTDINGDDSVVECVTTQDGAEINVSYNSHRVNTRIKTRVPVVNLTSGSMNNGFIHCEFTRVKKVDGDNKVFNLNKHFYILLAQGITNNKGSIQQHAKMPTVSGKIVNFKSFEIVEPKHIYMDKLYIKIHACVMVFAWMFCASIGIVVSRFYKPLWPMKRFCGRKVWFTIHRFLMSVLGMSVIGAFVVIFWEVQGISYINFLEFQHLHPVLGIIVTALTIIQIFFGLCRPTSASKNRCCFNWVHWAIGIFTHIIAVVNIILGVRLKKAGVHEYIAYVLYCFAFYQVVVVLVLEVVAYSSRIKERNQQTYSMYAIQATSYSSTKDGDSDEPPGSFALRVILRIHVIVVTLFTGSVIAIIAVI